MKGLLLLELFKCTQFVDGRNHDNDNNGNVVKQTVSFKE